MKFRKKGLLLVLSVILLAAVTKAMSFSNAKINNPAKLTISSSEEALIAVPEAVMILLNKNITKTITLEDLTDNEKSKLENSPEILTEIKRSKKDTEFLSTSMTNIAITEITNAFLIKNNLNEPIVISIRMNSALIVPQEQNIIISPGETSKVTFQYSNEVTEGILLAEIYASWSSGSATIQKSISISIVENIKEELIDLRKSVITEETKAEVKEEIKEEVKEVKDEVKVEEKEKVKEVVRSEEKKIEENSESNIKEEQDLEEKKVKVAEATQSETEMRETGLTNETEVVIETKEANQPVEIVESSE